MIAVDALRVFLRRAASEPFAYGHWDCAMTIANWVREQTGVDPAPALRGHYSTRLGWMRIVSRVGGLVPLVGSLALAAGMTPTEDPATGDIGVIDLPGIGATGAIKIDRGWAMKTERGIIAGHAPALAAWSFPECPKR